VKIEATVKQIRALLQLAELNEGAEKLTAEAYRRGHEAVQQGLPRLLLERYHSLIDAGRIPAVVAIERGACSGCHLRIPSMVEYGARRSPAVHICPHCRRLLYAPQLVLEDDHADDGMPSQRAAPASAARRS
jgi:predicted  nucleic acid-binding Zn-ribbon protein